MGLTQVKTSGLADDAVTGAKIADDTVAEANMANDAISLTELKAGTDGQIITWDASGNPTAVGPGTDGQVLTSTGAGSPPAFEALPTSGATLSGSTNNTVVTVTGSNAMQGEATLTYDGTNLQQKQTGNTATQIILDSNRSAADNEIGGIVGKWDTETVADMRFFTDDDTSNKDNGYISFRTSTASGSLDETLRLKPNRDVQITDGNLVIGTAGHGIDFSAAAGSAAGSTSALLDDYEEGTFTPSWTAGVSGGSYTQQYGHYVKNGNVVNVWVRLQMGGGVSATSSTLTMTMPFTSFNNSTNYGGTVFYYQGFEDMDTNLHVWVGGNSATLQFHGTTGGNFVGTHADAVGSTIYFHTVFRTA